MQQNFVKCIAEHGLYVRNSTTLHPLTVSIFGWLVTDSNEVEIVELMKRMIKEFEMSDLGVLS